MIRYESKVLTQVALILLYLAAMLAVLANAGLAWLSPW